MNSTLPRFAAAAAAALLTLGACNSEPETIESGAVDPQADALNQAAPVSDLKMIQASRTYRCKDNSLLYVDFYTNNTADARIGQDGERVQLAAGEGGAYTAEGWSLSGSTPEITATAPGHGTQSCKA
ncbi:MAG: hypothetical protein ACK40O_05935 [Allosphingosinicella sp.]